VNYRQINSQRQPTIQINITGTGSQQEIKGLNMSNKMKNKYLKFIAGEK
jgi:hypothetical protein